MNTVGDVIGRNRDAIVEMWIEGAGRASLAAGLNRSELVSVIPDYLTSLGRSTDDDRTSLSAPQEALIERHMSSRLRQGYTLNELVTEFAILGRCMSRLLCAEPAVEQPTTEDVARLFCELHAGVAAVTRIFNEHMLEDQQREKRYTRLLQRIASQAMNAHDPAVQMRKVLKEALNVFMEAMAAPAAALLLFDAKSNELIVSAAAGVADTKMEEYVASLEATFAQETASSDDPSASLAEAKTTEVGVSGALRSSGIHALLGVRPAAGYLLRCAMYVGIQQRRAFTPSEVRRIENLGSSLTTHLDNVRLHATLADKLQSVALEGVLRERFVSVLMHDLSGPLEAAKANAEQLRSPGPVSDREGVAADIVRDLERMDWMVCGLVDVHRIRAGQRLPLHLASCDLGGIAREAVEELRAAYGERFLLRVDRRVRGMWSADLLRRAIWNLAVNGIEHGAKGRPVVIAVTEGSGGAEVSIHNEGPQIPDCIQAELFRPFSLPGSTVHSFRCGWGLGLTLVWGCVEAHGGHVAAESHVGKGTTFRILIPSDARPYAD